MKKIFSNHIKNSTESEKRHAYGHAELMLEYLVQYFDKHGYIGECLTDECFKRVRNEYKRLVHDEIGVVFNSRDLVSRVLDDSYPGKVRVSENKRRGDMDQVY